MDANAITAIAILVGGFALVGLLWWLLVTTEGVYLGRGVVIWLYDRYAQRYDGIKQFNEQYEFWLVANPIMDVLDPYQAPLVLDVATGTGRLPKILCEHPDFDGHIIGVDLSAKMLEVAAEKLADVADRVDLLHCPAERLPFDDDSFDLVTCLEAVEFMQSPEAVLREMVRVLRPGGVLFITNRIGRHMMPGKTWTDEALIELLETMNINVFQAELWQVDYHKIWAEKNGSSPFIGAQPLADILRCPSCEQGYLRPQNHQHWQCTNCQRVAQYEDGVLDLMQLSNA